MSVLSTPNDRTRFAKCFVMIVERCRQWLQDFAENRVSARSPGMTLLQYIQTHRWLPSDSMIKIALNTMTPTSSQFDIAALRSIIVVGGLLDSHEGKTKNHAGNTLGDCVDRIREIRNTFMHTVSATLSQNEYNDYLTDFRDIARLFETENNMKKGKRREYVKMIDTIDFKPFEDTSVEEMIGYYNKYLDYVKLHEMVRIQTPVCPPSPAEPLNLMFLNINWLTFGLASGLLGDSNNLVVNAVNVAGDLGGDLAGKTAEVATDIVVTQAKVLEDISKKTVEEASRFVSNPLKPFEDISKKTVEEATRVVSNPLKPLEDISKKPFKEATRFVSNLKFW